MELRAKNRGPNNPNKFTNARSQPTNFSNYRSNDPIMQKDAEASQARAIDPHHLQPDQLTTYMETLMHHFKCNVGSGMFALGDAFKHAGLLVAPPVTIFLGFICIHAQHILLRCNEEMKQRLNQDTTTECPGYALTVELCFATGPPSVHKWAVFMRKLTNLFLCVTQLGFCCVYFVFISSNMQQVAQVWNINLSINAHMALVLIPIVLSTWIRNLKYLVPVSSIANVLIVGGYVATIFVMCHDLPNISERPYVAEWEMFPLFFGTVIYSFEGITLVLPLKNEMKKSRDFDRPLGVLNVGMVIVGGMFVVLGFLAYWKYGEDIQGSVTLNLEPKEAALEDGYGSRFSLPQCIKLAISLSILLTYALQFYVPISIMWPAVLQYFGHSRWPVAGEIVFRTLMCLLTFTLAELIPHLGLFISLVGAVSSTALALIIPPIMEMVVYYESSKLTKATVLKDIFIMLIGVLGCLTGTYVSIEQIVRAFNK